ncbi:hypothetical protein [Ruegeria arenilitoris]|uniref:hypothetical protein n=1 Tax=Ruegeria arenilitoris TaxID=1173585 RepID=UPI00147F2B6E|nr:hypothetical protein [Ruegeria arenilitoris]
MLNKSGCYLPVLDGPRLSRPDAKAEVIRRNNVLALARSSHVVLTGLAVDQESELKAQLPPGVVDCCLAPDVERLAKPAILKKDGFKWGKEDIGVGLLKALYAGKRLVVEEGGPAGKSVARKSNHLVICEEGEPISEVVAANYAYSLNAGLVMVPAVDADLAEEILENFYQSENSDQRNRLQSQLRELCGEIDLGKNTTLTVFSRRLPFGVGFPERPSTHLFTYPDCGAAVVNGFAAEQSGTRGVNVAVVVDPEKTTAPEIDAAVKILPKRNVFVRGYRGKTADVRSITDMVEYFPYDLLLFATHCGDAPGWRWTYEFTDSESIERKLVVDVAVGFGRSDSPDMVEVLQFTYFHSLDGVDWRDREAKSKLYVGTAITDYAERTKNGDLEPTEKEPLDRVRLSAAMAMHDDNYIPMPQTLADHSSPIVINNACVSWHELAGRFTFANARAYIGTLYPVLPFEAESVAVQLLNKQWGKPLPQALWASQLETYGDRDQRRPYVMNGVYTQTLRATSEDVPRHILGRLSKGSKYYSSRVKIAAGEEKQRLQKIVEFYGREVSAFRKKWFPK